MHLVRKKPRRREPLLEMCKIQANMAETHQLDERDNNSRGERDAGKPTNTHKNGHTNT